MAQQKLSNITPVNITFNPNVYEPGEAYKPFAFDSEGLTKAMLATEARRNEALNNYAELKQNLGTVRSTLHETEWDEFDKKAEQALDEIQTEYNAGNYGFAKNLTKTNAADLVKYTVKKAKDNELYLAHKKELDARRINGKISAATQEWALSVNDYYSPEDGVYRPIREIYDDFNITPYVSQAYNAIKPDQITSGKNGETIIGNDGKTYTAEQFQQAQAKNSNLKAPYTITSGYAHTRSEVKASEIIANLQYLLKDRQTLEQIKQQYEVDKFQLEKLLDERDILEASLSPDEKDNNSDLNDLNYQIQQYKDLLWDGSGSVKTDKGKPDYKHYFERYTIHNMLAQNLAFVNDSYTSQSSIGTLGNLTSKSNTTNPSEDDEVPINERTTPAPSTEQQSDLNKSRNNATQSAKGVTSILNKDSNKADQALNRTPNRHNYGTNAN